MKKLLLILLAFPLLTTAQEATIHFDIKNCAAKNVWVTKDSYTNPERLFETESEIEVPLINGKADWSCKLTHPIQAITYYKDSVTGQYYSYVFYLSPGDNLIFSFDSKNSETMYAVKGKGSKNNQPLIQKLVNNRLNLDAFKKDSLPNQAFKAIQERHALNQKILKDYISKNRPTKDFENIHTLYVQYFPMWTYVRFKGNQKFNIRQPYLRNETKWQAIEDSLTHATPLNNTELLSINEYDYFLSTYLTRIKERIWLHPELLKGYYGTATQEEAVKIHNEDPENHLQEKIIEKHFTGKTAEFLYGVLFHDAINEKEDNLPEIFSRFKEKYPQSQYIPYIEPAISGIIARRERKLNDEMIFLENNEAYQTFDDVLKLIKGKTVLLDMWGTWCGPCLSEIIQNSDSIKNHFKDKGLDYLYIANHENGNEKKWKELISYYNLTGTHILASEQLTNDIMKKVDREGFPTYVIIKRDGTFELSEAGYPMNRKILINQLEKALEK
jgi:thiol-disulfide isomerase/thioredoxin